MTTNNGPKIANAVQRPAEPYISWLSRSPRGSIDRLYRMEIENVPDLFARLDYGIDEDGCWCIFRISLGIPRAGHGTRLIETMFALHPEVNVWKLTNMRNEGRPFFASIARKRPDIALYSCTGERVTGGSDNAVSGVGDCSGDVSLPESCRPSGNPARKTRKKTDFVRRHKPDPDYNPSWVLEIVHQGGLFAELWYGQDHNGDWWILKIQVDQPLAGYGTRLLDAMFTCHPEVVEWHITGMSVDGEPFFTRMAAKRRRVTLFKVNGEILGKR